MDQLQYRTQLKYFTLQAAKFIFTVSGKGNPELLI